MSLRKELILKDVFKDGHWTKRCEILALNFSYSLPQKIRITSTVQACLIFKSLSKLGAKSQIKIFSIKEFE